MTSEVVKVTITPMNRPKKAYVTSLPQGFVNDTDNLIIITNKQLEQLGK